MLGDSTDCLKAVIEAEEKSLQAIENRIYLDEDFVVACADFVKSGESIGLEVERTAFLDAYSMCSRIKDLSIETLTYTMNSDASDLTKYTTASKFYIFEKLVKDELPDTSVPEPLINSEFMRHLDPAYRTYFEPCSTDADCSWVNCTDYMDSQYNYTVECNADRECNCKRVY